MSWIDTHAHFDAAEFDTTRSDDWAHAQRLGVVAQVVPAVAPFNFETVRGLAHAYTGTVYALGIHPMYVNSLDVDVALAELRGALLANIEDSRLVAVGEIGLDGFVEGIDQDKQLAIYQGQLKLAREFNLPVLLHVRRAQDTVIKYLRQFGIKQGIAHAFNGSFSQAQAYIKQGIHLGFGGMMTFEKSNQIRRLAAELPIESLVLETDAPDMSPAWAYKENNYSYYLPRIAETLMTLRGLSAAHLSAQLRNNTLNALPKIQSVL
ncbi:TatD family hydrolase [Hydromonas duriensis]|uniref:TatD DNase family protein n=1 Tax=Hydromonas duriensis TaxID=1527608 RepID=A0A4R6Y162_9BURK|nr:TatD family hydrolase [Hydromonas duriensis]TDR29082.1 TatD DNase family protein [Hydromonas duriensis]